MKLTEIIPTIKDKQYKDEFQELYDTLKETMNYYQQIHNSAKSIIETRLIGIERAIDILKDSSTPTPSTYSSDGQVHNNVKTNFTNKMI